MWSGCVDPHWRILIYPWASLMATIWIAELLTSLINGLVDSFRWMRTCTLRDSLSYEFSPNSWDNAIWSAEDFFLSSPFFHCHIFISQFPGQSQHHWLQGSPAFLSQLDLPNLDPASRNTSLNAAQRGHKDSAQKSSMALCRKTLDVHGITIFCWFGRTLIVGESMVIRIDLTISPHVRLSRTPNGCPLDVRKQIS